MTTTSNDLNKTNDKVPNPGSRDAQLMGCECPVTLNNNGQGYPQPDGTIGGFVLSPYCDVHRGMRT